MIHMLIEPKHIVYFPESAYFLPIVLPIFLSPYSLLCLDKMWYTGEQKNITLLKRRIEKIKPKREAS